MDRQAAVHKMTNQEKEALLKDLLGHDYKATSDNLPILRKAIDIAGKIDNTLSLAELVPAMNTVITGSRILSLVSTGSSLISVFMFPVASLISIAEAYEVGHRMYAYRCISYTITAWAFDRPAPSSSIKILANLRTGKPVARQTIIDEYNNVWRETSREVAINLNQILAGKHIPKQALQLILRASSDDNQQKLCDALMKGFEDKMSYIANLTWKSNYLIKYPN